MEYKPLILVTNDDGYQAKGLKKLADLMRRIGEVVVVSTEQVMSAKGHSITTAPTMTVTLVESALGYKEYMCNGTPVDCVKLGYQWLMDRKPDIVVSGINHGTNASANVIYSGTMAAVIEASMDGFKAVGFSLDCYDLDADFDHLDDYVIAITMDVLQNGLPDGVCLNVNFPKRSEEPIKGIKICHQAKGKWIEVFNECQDEKGGVCIRQSAEFVLEDQSDDADFNAMKNNYITVVPTQFDLSATQYFDEMGRFERIMLKK